MNRFADQPACFMWGGPGFRYPFTPDTFVEDSQFGRIPSFVLADAAGAVLGFGQYYRRAERCHLARLVIAPGFRGRGLGQSLVRQLAIQGTAALGVRESSLFVLTDNQPAMRLYARLGFVPEIYPGEMPALAGCIYMVAVVGDLQRH